MKQEVEAFLYKAILKPLLFATEPEVVHNHFTSFAKTLGKLKPVQHFTNLLFNYENAALKKEVLGITFKNPVGLSAGYDYDGHFVGLLPNVGFGFSTVGTVTNKPFKGNPGPMFARLPKSKSLLVNKGFKNDGADLISKRLQNPELADINFGVSVGTSNVPEINNLTKAIEDCVECFNKLSSVKHVKFWELNISCPNVGMEGLFTTPQQFEQLAKEILALGLRQPIFIKMPNEISSDDADLLVKTGLSLGIHGYIFGNLVKNRANPAFRSEEILKVSNLKGNFSGKPTQESSNSHLKYFRQKYGKDIVLVGTGGIFTPQDALTKLKLGADLVQLITGMIFEGPQLIGQITREISKKATDLV